MMTTQQVSNNTTDPARNKYHTLTLAEAKKLNRSLATGSVNMSQIISQPLNQNPYLYSTIRRAPLRTASVLHKPRAPPIVVTDLDTTIDQLDGASLGNYPQHSSNLSTTDNSGSPERDKFNRSASIRSASLCPTGAAQFDTRRHTVNYGRSSTMTSRTSLYSASSSVAQRQSSINDIQQLPQRRQQPQKTSLEESISNLSFKSSLDTTDGTSIYDPCRMQTMSVDLGSHYSMRGVTDKHHQSDSMARSQAIARKKFNTLCNASDKMFYHDSYSSAHSNVSSSTLRPIGVAPVKSLRNNMGIATDTNKSSPRSASKLSLSASTYRVFQSPLANFRRFLRNMPRPFSANSDLETKMEAHFDTNTSKRPSSSPNRYTNKNESCRDQSLGELSLSDSVSQISLNKSQSPPVCPPPPGQLKSMCYMESAINYSNYDEFTRSRNEKMAQRQQSIKDNLTGPTHQSDDQHSLGSDHSDAWQLTSLPVYYERNLTTVFEEKQAANGDKNPEMVISNNGTSGPNSIGGHQQQAHLAQHEHQRQNLIRPPIHFDDNGDTTLTSENINKPQREQQHQEISSGSMQSLNSCLTTGSAGQQQAPVTPYRFSFAQPLKQPDESSCVVDQVTFQKNIGLPPRMPTEHRLSINTSELASSTRQDNSSSGNSSNCSSQLNGMNNCDRPNSLDAASADKLSFNSNEDSTSTHTTNATANNCSGYGNLNGLADNETDLTLLSETSTLQGDTGIAYYANKCSELERTVASLKNKLISKEKELTDLQLNQLNNDYAIERLKKQVGRLERENAQLKTIVASKS